MKRKWIVGIVLIGALAVPAGSWAHKGHTHKVMGIVTSIDGRHLMVKTTDGKTAMVMLDAKTKITQGKKKVDVAAVKVGDRVVAEGKEEKEMIVATSLQLGTPPAATPTKK